MRIPSEIDIKQAFAFQDGKKDEKKNYQKRKMNKQLEFMLGC